MSNPKSDNEPMVDLDLRLPKTLYDDFVKFCDMTRRDRADMAREILQLFFAGGFRVAFERIRAGKWPSENRDETNPDELAEEFQRAIDSDEKKKADPE